MRLKELTIENYRSLKATKLSLSDLGITTLIGANGSGKSNVLKAIVALIDGDAENPSDDDIYAEEGVDGQISIAGTFLFEEKDRKVLEDLGLGSRDLAGIKATVTKVRGEAAALECEPVGDVDVKGVLVRFLAELYTIANKLKIQPGYNENRDEFLNQVRRVSDSLDDTFHSELDLLEASFRKFHFSNETLAAAFQDKLDSIQRAASSDTSEALEDVLGHINAELLDLSSYQIENGAPIDELSDRKEHPFLFDLLTLGSGLID